MRVEFKTLENGLKTFTLENEEKYILLSYFLLTFRSVDLAELIEVFEKVATGEKNFEQVWDPNVYLTFGNGSGYIELDKNYCLFCQRTP